MQVTIYLDDELARELDERAHSLNMSRSRCIQVLLRKALSRGEPTNLLASWGLAPDLDASAREHLGQDVPRESLP